jgi:uncharacterized protein YccT (UPF0319 family)
MRARITGDEALQAPTSLPQLKAQTRCTVLNLSGIAELERVPKGEHNADNEYQYWLGTILQDDVT